MIWYVITDSAQNYRSPHFYNTKLVLEEQAEDLCLVLHYRHVDRDLLAGARPWAICHSGGSAFYDEYDVLETAAYAECIKDWDIPQIGFCGGHQIISTKYGSQIGWMRPLRDDEPDLGGYAPGHFKEWGVYPVRILEPDPLFEGLPTVIRVPESHCWEVQALGQELRLLATNDTCRVQAYRHVSRPLYGVQFHPEGATSNYPDGWRVLRNFFSLARRYASSLPATGSRLRHAGT